MVATMSVGMLYLIPIFIFRKSFSGYTKIGIMLRKKWWEKKDAECYGPGDNGLVEVIPFRCKIHIENPIQILEKPHKHGW